MYIVYILQGSRYYVGMTVDIERRLSEHKAGKVASTSKMLPVSLIGWYPCANKKDAISLERKIKRSKNIKRYIGREGFVYTT